MDCIEKNVIQRKKDYLNSHSNIFGSTKSSCDQMRINFYYKLQICNNSRAPFQRKLNNKKTTIKWHGRTPHTSKLEIIIIKMIYRVKPFFFVR